MSVFAFWALRADQAAFSKRLFFHWIRRRGRRWRLINQQEFEPGPIGGNSLNMRIRKGGRNWQGLGARRTFRRDGRGRLIEGKKQNGILAAGEELSCDRRLYLRRGSAGLVQI